MNLFGQTMTRCEVEARVANLDQIGGVRRMRATEGFEDGTELIQVRTGAGFSCMVSPSHALDIANADLWGAALGWMSPNQAVHPSYYDPRGVEWLRSCVGGLLMTCGLTQAGMPCTDAGREQGLHGRAHQTPARHVCCESWWDGDDHRWRIAGRVEETSLFGEVLHLYREITGTLGENRVRIRDRVENVGPQTAPLMLVYHFNFGYPLISESTTLSLPPVRTQGRAPGVPLEGWDRFDRPTTGYAERVYYHDLEDAGGTATARICNPVFPLSGTDLTREVAVELVWSAQTLPMLVQWKMPGAGVYVLGVEPSNCRVGGRAAERERHALRLLEPGEMAIFDLEFSVQ